MKRRDSLRSVDEALVVDQRLFDELTGNVGEWAEAWARRVATN